MNIDFAGDFYTDIDSAVADIQKMLDAEVAYRWYQMGVIMGARVKDLEMIRSGNLPASESEARALKEWLRNSENATWQRLVDAVGQRAGGNNQRLAKSLSKEIAEKLSVSSESHFMHTSNR